MCVACTGPRNATELLLTSLQVHIAVVEYNRRNGGTGSLSFRKAAIIEACYWLLSCNCAPWNGARFSIENAAMWPDDGNLGDVVSARVTAELQVGDKLGVREPARAVVVVEVRSIQRGALQEHDFLELAHADGAVVWLSVPPLEGRCGVLTRGPPLAPASVTWWVVGAASDVAAEADGVASDGAGEVAPAVVEGPAPDMLGVDDDDDLFCITIVNDRLKKHQRLHHVNVTPRSRRPQWTAH